jgi:hypothetical protein
MRQFFYYNLWLLSSISTVSHKKRQAPTNKSIKTYAVTQAASTSAFKKKNKQKHCDRAMATKYVRLPFQLQSS